MSRLLAGFVNRTEERFEEKERMFEKMNNHLQAVAILQVRAEMLETIQNRWEWFETLPDEFTSNGLFIENLKDELRGEARQMIDKQKEMGMDRSHLRQLEEMLVIS